MLLQCSGDTLIYLPSQSESGELERSGDTLLAFSCAVGEEDVSKTCFDLLPHIFAWAKFLCSSLNRLFN